MTALACTIHNQENISVELYQAFTSLTISGSPIANAGGPYRGITHIPVQFDGTYSYDPDGSIFSYTWYCGDGTVENTAAPNHIYATPGTYTLTLTVKDDDGNCGTDSTTVNITKDNPPMIQFTSPLENSFYFRDRQLFMLDSKTIIIGPSKISVNATDDVTVRRVEFYIDDVLKHVDYEEPYTMDWKTGLLRHTIKAVAFDPSGQQSYTENTVFKWRLHPLFILGTLSSLNNGKTKDGFSWFSDKDTNQHLLLTILSFYLQSNQQDNSILMQLIEKILHEQRDSIDIIEFLDNHPILKNSIKEQYPLLYMILRFTNGPFDANEYHLFTKHRLLKTIILFWIIQTIGDDKKTNKPDEYIFTDSAKWIRDHPFLVLGSALLLLMILSKLSETTSSDEEDTDVITENKPPYADTGGPYNEQVGIPILFSAEKSYDEDGTIVSFDWDFGDSTKGTGKTVSHRYNTSGTFIISLTVTDDKGKTSTDTTITTISSNNEINTYIEDNNHIFWIISASLSALLLVCLIGIKFRRRLFE
jgi:PKD repeat protein